jgi:hypothetical protein
MRNMESESDPDAVAGTPETPGMPEPVTSGQPTELEPEDDEHVIPRNFGISLIGTLQSRGGKWRKRRRAAEEPGDQNA